MNRVMPIGLVVSYILVCLLTGCGGPAGGSIYSGYSGVGEIDPVEIEPSGIETFESSGGDICREDGRPVIRLFSTTWCPHCRWISGTFDDVVKKYADEGLIVARHWELDTGDDTLTGQLEPVVPEAERAVFTDFNPRKSIPTFVFGCRYYRVGNAYEQEDDLESEAAEFRAVIEKLIAE